MNWFFWGFNSFLRYYTKAIAYVELCMNLCWNMFWHRQNMLFFSRKTFLFFYNFNFNFLSCYSLEKIWRVRLTACWQVKKKNVCMNMFEYGVSTHQQIMVLRKKKYTQWSCTFSTRNFHPLSIRQSRPCVRALTRRRCNRAMTWFPALSYCYCTGAKWFVRSDLEWGPAIFIMKKVFHVQVNNLDKFIWQKLGSHVDREWWKGRPLSD